MLVYKSRDPECDAARALQAMNRTGVLVMLDGKTRQPRSIINIAKAAKLTAVEGPHGPHFERYRSATDRRRTARGASHCPEDTPASTGHPASPQPPVGKTTA
jgi:hypothetical protein